MLILGYVRVRLTPQGYERGLVRAPQGLELEKSKIRGEGGLFVLQEQNRGLSRFV